MTGIERLIELLQAALESTDNLDGIVSEFLSAVSNGISPEIEADKAEVLRALAYDLEFYVKDPEERGQAAAYFGEARAIAEIREALEKLQT